MEKYVTLVSEHFPQHSDVIRSLANEGGQFFDLMKDYHDTHERLERSEGDPGEKEQLEARRSDLGDEMRLIMENYGRV